MSNQESSNNIIRDFKLTSFAVDNATSIILLTLMIVLFGIRSYNTMPKEQYPEIIVPRILINTIYAGNSASDIENLVTRPLEKEMKSITGIDKVSSTSMQDFSSIIVEFSTSVSVSEALEDVKEAVDKARSELPNDLTEEPDVEDINLAEFPILSVNISGDFGMDELRNYAEYLQDEIEALPEVSKAEMKGALEREVKIDLDLPAMQSLRIVFFDVEEAIQEENVTISGGEIATDDFKRALRVVGEFKTVKEIENIVIKSERQSPIYLKDIATVTYGFQERKSYARSGGLPVISLDVVKRKGANLLDASDKIKLLVEEAYVTTLPESLDVTLFNDQSVQTRSMVSNLENSIISGVILVVVILLFFLGFRNALFVGISIPLSMLMGILFLGLAGVTINMVVLFSLILALGLLVDNAIVVVENIYRYRQNGYDGEEASKQGAGEVAMPIIASTATTLAAFLPMAFWPGLMGSFMKYLPITLIIVLTSSLFVALVINPVLTSRLMKVDEKAVTAAGRRKKVKNILIGSAIMLAIAVIAHFVGILWLRNILGIAIIVSLVNFFLMRPGAFYFQNRILPALESAYDRFMRFALRGTVPYFIFGGTFALLFFAIGLLNAKMPKVEYFPSADPFYINVFVDMPMGSDIEATNRLVKRVEQDVAKTVEPYSEIVDAILTQIGEGTADPSAPTPTPGFTPHKARITVAFLPSEKRNGISTFEIMEKIRESVSGYPGVDVSVDKNQDGPASGKPINMEIVGEDIETLTRLSEDLIAFVNAENIPGIEDLKADVRLAKPELIIDVNRETARRYGIATRTVAATIRTALYGTEASQFKDGEDEYPIQIRLDEKYRNNITDLLNQKILWRSQANGDLFEIPISAVASVKYTTNYSSIKRVDLDKAITVYSNVLKGYNANEIVEELQELIQDFKLPLGYTISFTGEQQKQADDLAFLNTAFMVALFSIFLIIVAQFNSIVSPFIIILSVLFSTIGVFLGYAITGMDLVVIMTGVGIISLAGIVVNNAIVLIDYIDLTRSRKKKSLGLGRKEELVDAEIKESIVEGGKTRLRPVLLTAITTILGLVPLAIGFNINFFSFVATLDAQFFIGGDNVSFWGPMAWTVIYGLTFATFLTLVVVPVMYWLFFKWVQMLQSLLGTKPETTVVEEH